MKDLEKLIEKKVKGFKFEDTENIIFDKQIEEYIGVIGIIKKYEPVSETFGVSFIDDSFYYPADQIEAHLVEDEIPTLSDGVMMLVSDDDECWAKREVYFKYNDKYYAKPMLTTELIPYKYAKPLEPTKEEQLKAILGSDEKVSEIMELFKN